MASIASTQLFFGLYLASNNINTSHKAVITSTIILKEKFFPVMKGKNIELETMKAKKGTAKIPAKSKYLIKFRLLFIKSIC